MSMYEFSALVEDSIHTLVRNPRHPRAELRSLYQALYNFEGMWDTSFTQFRVMDLLILAHYTYQFAVTDHPDYAQHAPILDAITRFTFINTDLTAPDDHQKNPTAGYIDPPYLYCDAGSPLWRRFVDLGVLTGPDAVAPPTIDLIETALIVITDARRQGNAQLISEWFALLPAYFYANFDEDERSNLMQHPQLSSIKEIIRQTGADAIPQTTGLLVRPPSDEIANEPLLHWWYTE